MMRTGILVVALAMLAVGLAAPSTGVAQDRREPQPKTPIKHLIVLMQENHSFDNYFGTYPGADGIPPGTCMPVDPTETDDATCIKPFHLGNRAIKDLDHSQITFRRQYRDRQMDGFLHAFSEAGKDGMLTMGYYDDRDLPFYWSVADEYVLFDRFFSSASGGSVKNHMYWVAGAAGNKDDSIPPEGWGDIPTIFDRLQERGISWKFYVQNYDPTITFRNRSNGDRGAQVVWVPLLAYARYLDDPELFQHIVPLEEYFTDLDQGTLPAVAYVVPSGASEHPPGSILAGQRFVKSLLNGLMKSSAWPNSAFLWTYDDWGGWYDHVPPPQVDEHGYGFRVPALLVSPYARKGFIDSTELDYTSILKFIEDNYALAPLAERDARAISIVNAFDFSQPPRSPRIIPATRGEAPRPEPWRPAIYIAYSSAMAMTVLLIVVAQWRTVRSRPRRAGQAVAEERAQ
jgi:phospholipase C